MSHQWLREPMGLATGETLWICTKCGCMTSRTEKDEPTPDSMNWTQMPFGVDNCEEAQAYQAAFDVMES